MKFKERLNMEKRKAQLIVSFWHMSVIISMIFFHSYNYFFKKLKWIVSQISATYHSNDIK